jgi:hypothetical protein
MALGHFLSQSISRSEEYSIKRAPATQPTASLSGNLNRLLSAAIVNPRFQNLLLTNPVAALAAGYNGETFQLTQAEYAAVTSLCVSTLRDFATQLLRDLQESVPFGTEAQPDFRFADTAPSGRENNREQPASLPCKQEGKPELPTPYSRFSAPTRYGRQSVAVSEGYRSNRAAKSFGS